MAKQKKSKKARVSITRNLYTVEKILSKRYMNGKVQYYLKWLGYPESENTWEPKENLKCPSLISDFEKQLALESEGEDKERQKESRDDEKLAAPKTVHYTSSKKELVCQELKVMTPSSKACANGLATSLNSTDKVTDSAEPLRSGFIKGWEAETILGATEYYGQRLFLIKWFVCL